MKTCQAILCSLWIHICVRSKSIKAFIEMINTKFRRGISRKGEKVVELERSTKGASAIICSVLFLKSKKSKGKYQGISLKTPILLLLRLTDYMLFLKSILENWTDKKNVRLKVAFWIDLFPRLLPSAVLQVSELFHPLLPY